MAPTQPQLPDPEKLLDKLKPEIHQRIFSDLKKLGPSLKQFSQGSLRVFFIGAILLPLAAAGADSAQIAQAIAAILGGISTEHFTDWIKRFCNADRENNDALKTQLMDEATDQILNDLQNLIEKVDALAAAQQALGAENANWIKQNLFSIRPLPADSSGHRVFRRGAWISDPRFVACTLSFNFDPAYCSNDFGFRCARA